MDVRTIDILELLPQRPPFVMIDRLTHFDETKVVTHFLVPEAHLFVEEGVFNESGMIENIAQTCAARMGYINKYILKNRIKIGFIGAIKQCVIETLPKVGDHLITTVEVLSEVFGITLVQAAITLEGRTIASCEMKISITDIDSQADA